jgi:hypothetical protein
MSRAEIDQWLLNEVGYVTRQQAAQTVVNTPIPHSQETRSALRPWSYGRALVYPARDPKDAAQVMGYLDVKGAGNWAPAQREHKNGLATLGESIRESLFQNMVHDVLKDARSNISTVQSYAVIDAGFDVVHADGSRDRAGLYVRQGHPNRETPLVPGIHGDYANKMAIQNLLEKYGVFPTDNIQGMSAFAGENALVDFGHYIVKRTLPPGGFEDKRVPFEQWGINDSLKAPKGDTWFYSKQDRPWYWSHELAKAWAEGRADRSAVDAHFKNLLGPVRDNLKLKTDVPEKQKSPPKLDEPPCGKKNMGTFLKKLMGF